jgi:hypothetical protein
MPKVSQALKKNKLNSDLKGSYQMNYAELVFLGYIFVTLFFMPFGN